MSAPPTTTTAIDGSRYGSPMPRNACELNPASSRPTIAEQRPERQYTAINVLPTRTPESFAATGELPSAYTRRPNGVRCNSNSATTRNTGTLHAASDSGPTRPLVNSLIDEGDHPCGEPLQ